MPGASVITDDIIAAIISILLVVVTTIIYYDVLRITWELLPKFKMSPRKRIIIVILAIFVGHTLAVWIYGVTYWVVAKYPFLGSLQGAYNTEFLDYVYFSVVTYSSLGFGDLLPLGAIRMISGVEALNGLVLIGWSISFTYLVMHDFWHLHKPKK
ncbi:MAG: two pore domain potassium channel family protein [Proteobacteria bacterium]|nr:two pore domain potassium channel family protein [Pseudomonadota bacterium]